MNELKHKKIEVCFFKMLLTMTGCFIEDEKILDKKKKNETLSELRESKV